MTDENASLSNIIAIPAASTDMPVAKKQALEQQTAAHDEPKLFVKKLSAKAKLPMRGSSLAAGYDLFR